LVGFGVRGDFSGPGERNQFAQFHVARGSRHQRFVAPHIILFVAAARIVCDEICVPRRLGGSVAFIAIEWYDF
jgi:hypothetical protein